MYIRNSKLQSKTELSMLHTFKSYMYCMPDAFFTQWTLKKILIHIYQKEILKYMHINIKLKFVSRKGRIGKITKNCIGSGGIRTRASEETGALNQRLRPLGHATF